MVDGGLLHWEMDKGSDRRVRGRLMGWLMSSIHNSDSQDWLAVLKAMIYRCTGLGWLGLGNNEIKDGLQGRGK